VRVTQRFIAGKCGALSSSPVGTAEGRRRLSRPYGTHRSSPPEPSVETLGYFHDAPPGLSAFALLRLGSIGH
jgi:hypothetical protein